MAAAAATPDPEMAPKSMLATVFVCIRAPGMKPMQTLARLMSLAAMPPVFMMLPASTKNGMASSAKLFMPAKMRFAEFSGAVGPMIDMMERAEPRQMLVPMGTPSTSRNGVRMRR